MTVGVRKGFELRGWPVTIGVVLAFAFPLQSWGIVFWCGLRVALADRPPEFVRFRERGVRNVAFACHKVRLSWGASLGTAWLSHTARIGMTVRVRTPSTDRLPAVRRARLKRPGASPSP
jgi:hypothetical protein